MPTNKRQPDRVRILTVRIPDSLRRQLVELAAGDGRSLSSYLRWLLTGTCAIAKTVNNPTVRAAFEEVDRQAPKRAPMRTRKATPKKGGRRG